MSEEAQKTVEEIVTFIKNFWNTEKSNRSAISNEPLKKLFRQLLRQLDITQRELAAKIEVDVMTAQRWAQGKSVPREDKVEKIKNLLNNVPDRVVNDSKETTLSEEDLRYLIDFVKLTGNTIDLNDIPTLLRLRGRT